MERPEQSTTPGNGPLSPSSRRPDWLLLLTLFVLAGLIRCWLISHTEVTARDGVGFMRYAWQLKTQPWTHVLRENPHPPLYPFTILLVSYPVRTLLPGGDTFLLQLSAQLTTALASLLLIVPLYYLGRDLFDRRVGFWAAFLFQCLPPGARVLSDALSEGLFLLLAATACWLALRAFQEGGTLRFGLMGLCSGLAYLARPEGALIGLAMGGVLLGRQAWRGVRWPWRRVLVCGMSLALPALTLALPYMAVIGHFTNKTTAISVLHAGVTDASRSGPQTTASKEIVAAEPRAHPRRAAAAPPLAAIWAVWGPGSKDYGFLGRQVWCLAAVAKEVMRGFYYAAWLPALWGIYRHARRLRIVPGVWVILAALLMDWLALWRVAYVVGYVAERHSLLTVMFGMPWAAAGVTDLGRRLADFWGRRPLAASWGWILQSGSMVSGILLAALAMAGLPKTLEPLHTNRAGYHAAGLWLAAHALPDDQIMDPFCWAEYYAGQVFRRPCYDYPMSVPPRYVVLGGSKNEHERLPLIPYANDYAKKGTLVYHWCPRTEKRKAEEVLVYCVPAPAEMH
jgi:4-amino-4-deoxy-L-arabinose transferase-like glycosyltransferase